MRLRARIRGILPSDLRDRLSNTYEITDDDIKWTVRTWADNDNNGINTLHPEENTIVDLIASHYQNVEDINIRRNRAMRLGRRT